MGLFDWGSQAEAAGKGVGHVGKALDAVFTSDEERLTHAEMMARIAAEPHKVMGQLSLVEAAHRTVFVAGWRPFIGWVCGVALAVYFLPQYVTGAYIFVNEYYQTGTIIPFPVEPKAILELVLALLGMGGLRSFEKISGVAK